MKTVFLVSPKVEVTEVKHDEEIVRLCVNEYIGTATVSIVNILTGYFVTSVGRKYLKKGVVLMAKNPLQKKLKILEKIIRTGVKTEDDFKKITPKDLMQIDGLSFNDINTVNLLQENIKNGTLFSFLADGSEV